MDLRKRAGHHHVPVGRHQLEARLIIIASDIFGIGSVENQDNVLRQAGLQAAHFVDRNIGARRVAGIGKKDHFGVWRDRSKDRIDSDLAIGFLHGDRSRAGPHDLDLVNQEAMLGDDRLIAGRQIDVAEQAEQFIGPIAAHQVGDVEAIDGGDRLAQFDRLAVRIDFKLGRSLLEGLDRLRAWPQRGLVRRQLIDLGDTRRMLLARHVSGNIKDTGAWRGALDVCAHGISFRQQGNDAQPIPVQRVFVECDAISWLGL